jgi:hypothetical protein
MAQFHRVSISLYSRFSARGPGLRARPRGARNCWERSGLATAAVRGHSPGVLRFAPLRWHSVWGCR